MDLSFNSISKRSAGIGERCGNCESSRGAVRAMLISLGNYWFIFRLI